MDGVSPVSVRLEGEKGLLVSSSSTVAGRWDTEPRKGEDGRLAASSSTPEMERPRRREPEPDDDVREAGPVASS